MAATPADVKAITGSTLDDNVVQPFIIAAQCIILRVDANCLSSMTAECRDQGEAFLAAHLLTSSNVGIGSTVKRRESLAGEYTVERVVNSYSGQGVLGTHYGQTANSIFGGCLQETDLRQPSFASTGKDYDNNIGSIC